MSAVVAYTPAAGCEPHLDAWCMQNCPHASLEQLYARLDVQQSGNTKLWRCYAASTLDVSKTMYVRGTTYCTRQPQLAEQLKICRESNAHSEAYNSERVYGPSSGTSEAPRRRADRGAGAGGGAAAWAQQTTRLATPSRPETCVDTVPECAIWASYGECELNAPYMIAECPVACRACQRRAGGAAAAAQPMAQSHAARPLPPPSLPPPTRPPTPLPSSAPLTPPSKPPAQSRTPPSPPDTAAACTRACEPVSEKGGGESLGCSGRGRCSPLGGHQWCECANSQTSRFVGLRCEREVREGATCAAGCEEHGWCVHGYCECRPGWHGAACDQPGAPSSFLTVRSLFEAGLVKGRKGSKAAGERACAEPSYHHAYAFFEGTKRKKLLASLPEEAPTQHMCSTCALVSNAGSLLGKGYGAAIDANECVWRMNRGPTIGFEADVGRRTTLDMVNSFPHLRNLGILPRVGSPLVHGMTIELFESQGTGFEKYMSWVEGHATYKEQWPQYQAYVFDLAWMQASWEAYWAYLAPWVSPLEPQGRQARPSSGWHMARLALARCQKVNLYGFSMSSSKFHCAARARRALWHCRAARGGAVSTAALASPPSSPALVADFDSLVQETVTEAQRDPRYGYTHRFAWEHEVFKNWSLAMPERIALHQ